MFLAGSEHEQVGARLADAGSVAELVEVGDPVAPQRRAPLGVERAGERLGGPVGRREQLPDILGRGAGLGAVTLLVAELEGVAEQLDKAVAVAPGEGVAGAFGWRRQ